MEEIITVDGKQFKLTIDRPLTAEQKVQTIAEIRKQTGCGTCGPRVTKMGNDWQYGGVRSAADPTGTDSCPAAGASGGPPDLGPPYVFNPKIVDEVVTMVATPVSGVAPYSVEFRRAIANSMAATIDLTNVDAQTYHIPGLGEGGDRLGAANPATGVAEGTPITRIYTINATDIEDATTKAPDTNPTLVFASIITDSCGAPANQRCANFCKIYVGCAAPVCDFTVS